MALRIDGASAGSGMTALLQAETVSRSFGFDTKLFGPSRRIHSVVNVDLRVEEGDVLGIVGESGAGKSTLARLMLGLLRPDSGRVALAGQDVMQIGRRMLARQIQAVFQDPYSSLNPRRNIASIVALPLAVQGIGLRERRTAAIAMLERVGLSPQQADLYPGELSGGQRQRVAIARALVTAPRVVVLDEPTSALDVSVQAQILNLLMELRRDLGLTYVFISHNIAVVEHLATRVAVMYLGRVVEVADRDAVFRQPRHPYTRALLASVLTPAPGLGLPDVGLGLSYPDPLAPPSGCVFHPRCRDARPACSVIVPRPIFDGKGSVTCHLYGANIEGNARAEDYRPGRVPGMDPLSVPE
jgi:peptide/nickel transport system ATP-binding protein